MTTRDALHEAQRAHPLDLAARAAFILSRIDEATGTERDAWVSARETTRNGSTRRNQR